MDDKKYIDVPSGFAALMSHNIKAMKNFAMMSKDEQNKVIEHSQTLHSKQEMRAYVDTLGRMI